MKVGTDDDLAAEDYMVDWLTLVKRLNGIDLMPEFNRLVAEAHDKLMANPELLASISAAQGLGAWAKRFGIQELNYRWPGYAIRSRVKNLFSDSERLLKAVAMLDLTLPPLSEEHQRLLGKIQDIIAPKMQDAQRSDEMAILQAQEARRIFEKATLREQLKHEVARQVEQSKPFDAKWLKANGNRLRHSSAFRFTLCNKLLKRLEEHGEGEQQLQVVAQRAVHSMACKKVEAELKGMSDFLEKVQQLGGRLEASYERNGGGSNLLASLNDAHNALSLLQCQVKETPDTITVLTDMVEKLRVAHGKLNELFFHPAVMKVSAGLARRDTTEKAIAHQFSDARKRWVGKEKEKFNSFLVMMDAVGCDADKWMGLYRNTDRIFSTPPVNSPTPEFAERIASQRMAESAVQRS